MKADVGDRIVIEPRPGGRRRDGEVVEVHGQGGAPPYIVRWADSGRLALYFPGGDARVRHLEGSVEHGTQT